MRSFAIFALSALALACSDSGSSATPADTAATADAPEEESPDDEACEHAIDGPSHAVTAAATSATATDGRADHKRVDVTLIDVTGGKGGTVSWAADAAGDHAFYLSADVPFAVTDGSGNPVAIEAKDPMAICADVAVRHTVELDIGTYFLTFGPTDKPLVSYVAEALSGHVE